MREKKRKTTTTTANDKTIKTKTKQPTYRFDCNILLVEVDQECHKVGVNLLVKDCFARAIAKPVQVAKEDKRGFADLEVFLFNNNNNTG